MPYWVICQDFILSNGRTAFSKPSGNTNVAFSLLPLLSPRFRSAAQVRAPLIHPSTRACPSSPLIRPSAIPSITLPRRVRFAFHLCSYAERMFSRLPSPFLRLTKGGWAGRSHLSRLPSYRRGLGGAA